MRVHIVSLLVLSALVAAAGASFGASGAAATVSGANGKIAFGGGDIFVVDSDGKNLVNLTRNGDATPDNAPQWSPSGGLIAFESTGNRDIYLTSADGTLHEPIAATAARETLPSWAPDGKHVVYTSGSTQNDGDLYVWSRDQGTHLLVALPGGEAGAVYSPDGRTVAFTWTNTAGASDIYAINVDGSGLRRLTTTGRETQPDYSPDGAKLVFASKRGGASALYVMNADGSAQTRLSPASADAYESPAWSPNGAKLVYVRSRTGLASIWTMNADGSGETKVLTTQNAFPAPHWQPVVDVDPPTIALTSPVDGAVVLGGQILAADYSCDDGSGGSGVAACSAPVRSSGLLDTSTAGIHSFTVTARDYVGNVTSVTHEYTVVVDRTRPTIDIRNLPEGTTVRLGDEFAVDFGCADEAGGSGLQWCNAYLGAGNRLDTSYAGRHTVVFQAQDRAGNWTERFVDYWVVASVGNPLQRLEHLRDVLTAERAVFTLPGHRYARTRLERTLASLDLVLQPERWRTDGTFRPNAAGLAGMTELRQVAAHLYWGDFDLRDASWDVLAEPVVVLRDLAYARFDEVRTVAGNAAAPTRLALWRAEHHLHAGDGEEQPMRATLSYISAWGALIGQPPS